MDDFVPERISTEARQGTKGCTKRDWIVFFILLGAYAAAGIVAGLERERETAAGIVLLASFITFIVTPCLLKNTGDDVCGGIFILLGGLCCVAMILLPIVAGALYVKSAVDTDDDGRKALLGFASAVTFITTPGNLIIAFAYCGA